VQQQLKVRLENRFPDLYCVSGDNQFTQFGFEVGDGWFDLLNTLSADLMRAMQRIGMACPHAVQVKSKMGTLRFVLSDFNDPLDALINKAVKASTATCEQCGSPGHAYIKNRWVYVACDNHSDGGTIILQSR
jgi:hypothetical protein